MNNNIFQKKLNDLGPDVTKKIDDLFDGETKNPSSFVQKFEDFTPKLRKKAIKMAGAGLISLLVLCGFNGCVDKDGNLYSIVENYGEVDCPIKNYEHPASLTKALFDNNSKVENFCYFPKREYEIAFASANLENNTKILYIEPINTEYVQNRYHDFYAYAKHTINGLNYYSRTVFSLYRPEEQNPDYLNNDAEIKNATSKVNSLVATFNNKPYNLFIEELNSAIEAEGFKLNIFYGSGREISAMGEIQDDLNKQSSSKFAKFIGDEYIGAQIINTTIGDRKLDKKGSTNEKDWDTSLCQTIVGIAYTKDGTPEIFHIQFRYKDPFWKYEDYTSFYTKLVTGEITREAKYWKELNVYTSPINGLSYEIGVTSNNGSTNQNSQKNTPSAEVENKQ